ncbi:MAG: hypothetical protein ABIC95_02770 [archaeon]
MVPQLLYHTIGKLRERFGDGLRIRVFSNGKAIYNSPDRIKEKAQQLVDLGADELQLSDDRWHFAAGIDQKKLYSVRDVVEEAGIPLKVRYFHLDKAVPIERGADLPDDQIDIKPCINQGYDPKKPFLFLDELGNVYVCPVLITPPVGNLIDDDWSSMVPDLENELQQALLVGDIAKAAEIHLGSDKNLDHILFMIEEKGACKTCEHLFQN